MMADEMLVKMSAHINAGGVTDIYKRPMCGSFDSLRPYHPEHTRSRLISEVKQGWAWLVLGWETAWEYQVL